MGKNNQGTIKDIQKISEEVYSVKIYAPTVDEILPGQYISILCEGLTFRRPFSVSDFDNHIITVLIKKRGKGTEYILSRKVGSSIEFSAPLGNVFSVENKKTLLIGAGIGAAPLFYLNKKLKELKVKTFFAAGFLSKDDIIVTPHPTLSRKGRGEYDFVSTDDGSNGNKGSICDYLEKLIAEFKPEKIVSCAPRPVLKIVAQTAQQHGLDCEICMEKVMACGIGVCRGCVIQLMQGDRVINKTVCKDGPVFNGKEVVWQ
ncbi:MAG: FAD-binding oxidoreductase [Candidatus Gastranaerophilales bacterium]|nr:FAD-binding oxidoreductase [Candidatus Gastranaerophilales bacterium]